MKRVLPAVWFVATAAVLSPPGLAGDAAPSMTVPRILWPADGTSVSHHFVVRFSNGTAAAHHPMPAAQGMGGEMHRHVHLLIDVPPPRPGEPVPVDAHHRHFMGGETNTTVDLPPGRHTLQLLLAGADHVPDNPPIVSKKIAVTVK